MRTRAADGHPHAQESGLRPLPASLGLSLQSPRLWTAASAGSAAALLQGHADHREGRARAIPPPLVHDTARCPPASELALDAQPLVSSEMEGFTESCLFPAAEHPSESSCQDLQRHHLHPCRGNHTRAPPPLLRPRRCSAPSLVPLLSFPPALLAWPYGSAQSLSRVRLSETPWTAARQASLSITNSRSLLRLLAIESVTPSNRPAFLAKQALFQELELQDLLSLPACAGAGLSRPASWVWRGE